MTEQEKRNLIVSKCVQEVRDIMSKYNECENGVQTISSSDWELIERTINDIDIAIDVNDTEPIEHDWYGLFSDHKLKKVLVDKVVKLLDEQFYIKYELTDNVDFNDKDTLKMLERFVGEEVSQFAPQNDEVANLKSEYAYIYNDLIIDVTSEVSSVLKSESVIYDEMTKGEVNAFIINAIDEILFDSGSEFIVWVGLPIDEKDDYFTLNHRMGMDEWLCSVVVSHIYDSIIQLDYVKSDVDTPTFDKIKNEHIMAEQQKQVQEVVERLKEMDIDGESMLQILEGVEMDEHMYHQLNVKFGVA